MALALVTLVACLFLGASPAATQPAAPAGPEGFGARTTGGAVSATYWVENGNDSGPGSLRQGAECAVPAVIRFRGPTTVALSRHLMVGADKTIDGGGADVTITGRGLVLTKPNVIVQDLKFTNFGNLEKKNNPEDAILVNGASNVWIDHNTFTQAADKAIGVPEGTDITVSWNRFVNQDQVIQIGAFATRDTGAGARVTMHHNFFDNSGYRMPRISYGKVHAYDNYLLNWAVHGMSSVRGGQLLSEANIFEAGAKDNAIIFSGGDPDKDATPGFVRSEDDLLLNGARVRENEPAQVFDPATFYTATVEPATDELRQRLVTQTGWQAGAVAQEPSEPTTAAASPCASTPEQASPTQASPASRRAWVWWVVIGVLVAGAAVVVTTVALRRRSAQAGGEPGERPPSGSPPAGDRAPEPSSNR